jgi:hypothetical protein
MSISKDFHKKIKEYVGKSEHDRNKLFNFEKDDYLKEHYEILNSCI